VRRGEDLEVGGDQETVLEPLQDQVDDGVVAGRDRAAGEAGVHLA